MPALFKKCPSCGRRFEVKHTGEELEKHDVGEETLHIAIPLRPRGSLRYEAPGDRINIRPAGSIGYGERKVTTEVDTYNETYTCKNCGNQWTEKHVKSKRMRVMPLSD
jgi:hypothetical protein